MKIAVTGASGNVGTALLRRLATEGGHEIVGISRRRPPAEPPYDAATWHPIDLGDEQAADQLAKIFRGVDAVVHLAWLIQPGRDRELLRRVNQGGTRAVIEAVQRSGVGHLVHMSSIGTYSAAPGEWKDETWSAGGISTSSYSVDKAVCESLLDTALHTGHVSDRTDAVITRVRPALILQPDAASEISRYFLGRLVPVALLRPKLLRFAPLPREFSVQFVHTDDVAAAISAILRHRFGGPVNLAADPVIDREVFAQAMGGVGPPLPWRALRAAASLTWRARLQPTDGGWVDMAAGVPLLDTSRAREGLGWTPAHSSIETLTEFIQALHRGRGGPGPLLYSRR